ncbi:anthranilate synthase family protein [Cumulibacter soli]|uniref:anthranilate synthase family protein n=1 Tax=Cumulibacter soli TaxID=2546344 RepID=UPI001067A813|nr:chorismate-binding protein [Cumulibacter soli]
MSRIPATGPFALLAREGSRDVEILTGEVVDVERLIDIPLHDATGAPREVLALVPYRQVRERGYAAQDDGMPLRCLLVTARDRGPIADVLTELPVSPVQLANSGFDISDSAYAEIVREVIDEEISRGEGANFVIRRDYTADVEGDARTAALTWFRALLEHERGAYWTFAIVTEDIVVVGASPEVHVSARDGLVTMNPISGTMRHPDGLLSAHSLTEFLSSDKETEELFMVVDEELKMMSAVCADGGRISGPQLKVMSRLTHTEYVLRGTSRLDPREILRETMFAPTVTGSPMQNACAVIARREHTPRGYYAGVAALFTPRADGVHDLDAPILIRAAYLRDGQLRVPVGATLVRHSDPCGEVAETHAKAAGVLGAIGAIPRIGVTARADAPQFADDPAINALLSARNERLAPFWLLEQQPRPGRRARTSAIIVDAEDRFTTMLAHQLRFLGLDVQIVPWDAISDDDVTVPDILIAGPGPGDPREESTRMMRLREIINIRERSGMPLLAVCLSHQILAASRGIDLVPLDAPNQGAQQSVDLFGVTSRVGYYNSFTARVPAAVSRWGDLEVAADESGDVHAMRGPRIASVQGHLESILSRDGIAVLQMLVTHALESSES